jgi:hypothetical protein
MAGQPLLLEPPPIPEEVYTINNNHITKVYYRRKFKSGKRNILPAQDKEPIFEQTATDYSAPQGGQGSNTSTLKRKPTPASVTNLRRSKRQAGRNDGFKPPSLAVTRTKSKDKKKNASLGSSGGKTHTFLIPQAEFPNLAEIDRCVTAELTHPHILVPVLQKVA